MSDYIYQPRTRHHNFAEAVAVLQARGYDVTTHPPDTGSLAASAAVVTQLRKVGMTCGPYFIDVERYAGYVNAAGYHALPHDYYGANRPEKTLEHYLGVDLLEITGTDVFIDIASEDSPLAEFVERLFGATGYSQDIMYRAGINGRRIGGDACAMPVRDGFASKAVLTCSLEHFEGDADVRLFSELGRVLRPGGAVCVVPFYLHRQPLTMTDPTISVANDVPFDRDSMIYAAEGWGNRHGRHYSPETFVERLVAPHRSMFTFDIYYLVNARDVDPSVYARFALVATRV